MKTRKLGRLLVAAAFVATVAPGAPIHAAGLPSTQVAWRAAATAADVDAVFARARSGNKPVLLYWGATWCPPCNQLKVTLFNRQDFAALSRSFVAVHVDGDRTGAQQLGQRFKVTGYPTLLLLRPDGGEITRLPGEADAPQVMELLQLGLAGGRPVKAILDDVRAGRAVSPDEWRALAFYSWDTDDEQLSTRAAAAGVLAELAVASVAAGAETSARLWLQAVAASDEGKGLKADDSVRERVRRVLADPAQVRLHADIVANSAAAMVRALAETPDGRQAQAALFEPALRRLENDGTLSRGDRLSALTSRVELARIESARKDMQPSLPESLRAEVREHVARADHEIANPYERMAVIPSAAYALERAGLVAESEALLRANLDRSRSPYYLMSQLGGLMRRLGRSDEALRWYGRAFDRSEGPATRLQWGAGYLQALVDLAPADATRIEATALKLLDEAARDPGSFYRRSASSMKRIGKALATWNREGQHAASLKRLQPRLPGVCARVGEAEGRRQTCRDLLKAPAAVG